MGLRGRSLNSSPGLPLTTWVNSHGTLHPAAPSALLGSRPALAAVLIRTFQMREPEAQSFVLSRRGPRPRPQCLLSCYHTLLTQNGVEPGAAQVGPSERAGRPTCVHLCYLTLFYFIFANVKQAHSGVSGTVSTARTTPARSGSPSPQLLCLPSLTSYLHVIVPSLVTVVIIVHIVTANTCKGCLASTVPHGTALLRKCH